MKYYKEQYYYRNPDKKHKPLSIRKIVNILLKIRILSNDLIKKQTKKSKSNY